MKGMLYLKEKYGVCPSKAFIIGLCQPKGFVFLVAHA